MEKYRVAIVEDDQSTSAAFRVLLLEKWKGMIVDEFENLEGASNAIKSDEYDLVISDIDLGGPGDNYGGVRIAAMLRDKRTPVLIVSGLPEPDLHRKVFMALDAWDYLLKPVKERDFLTQVTRALQWRKARLKSAESQAKEVTASGDPDLVLDPLGRVRATWKGQRIGLSITETRIVHELVKRANQVVEHKRLFDALNSGRNKGNLRVHIGSIRSAFKDVDPQFNRIANVTMVGYTWRTG